MIKKTIKISLIVLFTILVLGILTNSCNAFQVSSSDYEVVNDTGLIYKVLPKTDVYSFLSKCTYSLAGENELFMGSYVCGSDTKIPKEGGYVVTGDRAVFQVMVSTGSDMGMSRDNLYDIAVMGDIDCNGTCDIVDLTSLIRHIVGLSNYQITDEIKLIAADVDGNDEINIVDLQAVISKIVLGSFKVSGDNNEKHTLTLTLTNYDGGYTQNGEEHEAPERDDILDYNRVIAIVDGAECDPSVCEYIDQGNGISAKATKQVIELDLKKGTKISLRPEVDSQVLWKIGDNDYDPQHGIWFEMPDHDVTISASNVFDINSLTIYGGVFVVSGDIPHYEYEYGLTTKYEVVIPCTYTFTNIPKISNSSSASYSYIEELYEQYKDSNSAGASATKTTNVSEDPFGMEYEGDCYNLEFEEPWPEKVVCVSATDTGMDNTQGQDLYNYEYTIYYKYTIQDSRTVTPGDYIKLDARNSYYWITGTKTVYGTYNDFSKRRYIEFYMPNTSASVTIVNTNNKKYTEDARKITLENIGSLYSENTKLEVTQDNNSIVWVTYK